MTAPNSCGACKFWDLSHALGLLGYGRCNVQPNPMLRAGQTTSEQCICRIGRFVKADAKTLRLRETKAGPLL